MSSKPNEPKKKAAPMRVIRLDQLQVIPPPPSPPVHRQQERSGSMLLSQSEQAEPVMDGITTTSELELPFDLDQHDSLFQDKEDGEKQTKDTSKAGIHTPGLSNQSTFHGRGSEQKALDSAGSGAHEQPTRTQDGEDDMSISETDSPDKQNEMTNLKGSDDQDMDISDGEDSSIDMPLPPKHSGATKRQGTARSQTTTAMVVEPDENTTTTQSHQSLLQTDQSSSTSNAQEAAAPRNADASAMDATRTLSEQSDRPSEDLPTRNHHRPRMEELSADLSNRETNNGGAPRLPSTVTADNKENSPSVEPEIPPLGEYPRPNLNEEEQRLFDKIDLMILNDEWKELHDKIENQISEAEEEDLFSRIDQSIRAAEDASKPGGRVLHTAWIGDDGSLQEHYPTITKDPLAVEEEERSKRRLDDAHQERVSCVEDLSTEVLHKMKLPKFVGDSKDRLLNRQSLNANIVAPIVAREQEFVLPRKLSVRLDDASDDPFSVVLHCQGHPDLVKLVEEKVTAHINALVSRTKARCSPSPQSTDKQRGERRQTEKQQSKNPAYKTFLHDYKDAKELEYKGSPIHMQRVNKVMWESHKELLGLTRCGEACPCPRQLELLTRNVVQSYVNHESRKDPSWRNPLECADDESPVGFVNHFAPRYFERLEREFPDELPKQILQRLVLMWKEHRRTQRFGIKCSKHCPCKEGWEIVFKRGRLREGELAEESTRVGKSAAPRSSSSNMQIPRRRPSNERSSDAAPKMLRQAEEPKGKDTAPEQMPTRIPRRSSTEISRTPATGGAPRLPVSSVHPRSEPASSSSSGRIARRPSLERTSADDLSSNQQTLSASLITNEQATANPSSSTMSLTIEYNPGEQMGFFCVTEMREKEGKKEPVCMITSLSDVGRRKDSRLQPGAIVSTVTDADDNTQSVRTYTDLKVHYEKAKKNLKCFRVRFTNPAPSFGNSTGLSSHQANQGEWTASGEWIGSSSRGWAGGARCYPPNEQRSGQSTEAKTASNVFRENGEPQGMQTRNIRQIDNQLKRSAKPQGVASKPVSTALLQYSTSMVPAKHRKLSQLISILREPAKRSEKASLSDNGPGGASLFKQMAGAAPSKRKVKFSGANDERFYEPKSESYKMATEVSNSQSGGDAAATRDSFSRKAAVQITPGTKELIDAIENKGYRDVIAILQGGACPTTSDDLNKTPKDHVKDRLAALDFELKDDPGNENLAAEKKDFDLKRKVLSIFIEAIVTIKKARFNEEWERFDVKIERIKNVCLSVRDEELLGSQVLDYRTFIKGEEMRQTPLIPMQGTILHNWWNEKSSRPYKVNYNPQLTDNSRSNDIVVCLYKGQRSKKQVLLGKGIFPISQISASVADASMDTIQIEEELPRSAFLTSATIVVFAEKAADEDQMRKDKSKEASAKLKDVIQWIDQFNKETKVDSDDFETLSLSGHIVAPNCGISLLHAAIYLDEPDLVKQLMKLGADPEAPSDVGCARMLAENKLGERGEEKSAKQVLALLKGASTSTGAAAGEDGEGKGESANPSARAHPTVCESAPSAEPQSAQNSAVAESGSQVTRSSLPVLNYWIKPDEEHCRFFGRAGVNGCHKGARCRFLHVCPLVGRPLDKVTGTVELDPKRIIVKCLHNERDCDLFTAAYCGEKEKELYRAEGGLAVGDSSKAGVYWYKTKAAAIDALKRVMSFRRTHPIVADDMGIYGPQSSTRLKRPRDEQPAKKQRSTRAKLEPSSRDKPSSLLARLMRQPNLSLIHNAIFQVPLRRSDWEVRKNNCGLVTATLISPDRSRKYPPSEEAEGEWMDRTYWYKDERSAKASAFLSLLRSCITFGLVNADCTLTKDGKRLPF